MQRIWRRPASAVTMLGAAVLIAGLAIPASAEPHQQTATQTAATATPNGLAPRPACEDAGPGQAACQAIEDTGLHWTGRAWTTGPAPATAPRTAPPARTTPAIAPSDVPPFMAADLQSAYQLPSRLLGGRQVIAIVDAYDDPNAEADLAVYRAANHLPGCDASSGCFTKVNAEGQQGNYPPADPGWAGEESLDVDMASAACPNCKIILVEADDSYLSSLAVAENEAAKLGATVISNSYAATEYAGQDSIAAAYDHPGIAITAASGDWAYNTFNAMVPAAFGTVTSVGGTALWRSATPRGWSEAAWQYAGSGCSSYVAKPAWQHDQLCGTRVSADVAAVADPNSPVAAYDTYGAPGWLAFGGTSVAAPLIAGVYALAGNTDTIGVGASWAYAHRQYLTDITADPGISTVLPPANGECGGSYLCTTGPGYDGPTGLGSPLGIGAF